MNTLLIIISRIKVKQFYARTPGFLEKKDVHVEGTVSVIFIDPPCINLNVRFNSIPFKALFN